MRITDQKNFVTALFYIGLGVVAAIASSRYPIGSADRMGPGYFPLGVALLLTGTGLVILMRSLARHVVSPDGGRPEDKANSGSVGPLALKNTLIVMVAVVLFGVVLEPLGLLCAIALLIGVSSLAHHNFSWRSTAISILVLIPLVWVIFVWLLELPLPLFPSFLA